MCNSYDGINCIPRAGIIGMLAKATSGDWGVQYVTHAMSTVDQNINRPKVDRLLTGNRLPSVKTDSNF